VPPVLEVLREELLDFMQVGEGRLRCADDRDELEDRRVGHAEVLRVDAGPQQLGRAPD
jgi:hypothetical protein